MKQVKSLKHYLLIFVIATFAIFLFSTIDAIQNGSYDTQLLLTGAVAPGTFTILLFIFDKIFDLIFPKKLKNKNVSKDNYSTFLNVMNNEMSLQTKLSIEDYRRLRDSERFQKALRQAFRIFEDGESQDISYEYLIKKFKKDSREHTAMKVVVNEVKKLRENS